MDKISGGGTMKLPLMVKVKQEIDGGFIQDIEGRVRQELEQSGIQKKIRPGHKIALTQSSRGVSNITRVLKATSDTLKAWGAEPFIVLGMGSHGGGTVEGQLKIAEKYGVTEKTMEVPIRATMDVVSLGTTAAGVPVYTDRFAFESDGVIVVHRVKAHRQVMGPHQSGLLKMLTIGLGKLKGAATVHSMGWENFDRNLVEVAGLVLKKAPILLGLALVENGFGKTAHIEAVEPRDFVEKDAALLQMAIRFLPRIPFQKIDVLVVKEMGKNLLPDTLIIGRFILKHFTGVIPPDPTRTVILEIFDDSLGNAVGMGSFHYTTERFFKKIDFRSTVINAVAGNVPEAALLPLPLPNDRGAIEAALQNSGFPDVEGVRDIQTARLVLIKNTIEMGAFYVSQCLVPEIRDVAKYQVVGAPFEIPFNGEGNLALDFSLAG